MSDNLLEQSIRSAVIQTGHTLFLKQCIDDGLLTISEDPGAYAMGKRSARQVFINRILQDICGYALWHDHGGPYERNALYFKAQHDTLYYRFQKSEPEELKSESEELINGSTERIIEGSITLSELGLQSLPVEPRSCDVHQLLLPRLHLLWQALAKSGDVTMKQVSADVDWRILNALFDQISYALQQPTYFHQRVIYLKYIRSVPGQTPTVHMFLIPVAVIENFLKEHQFVLKGFWHPARFWNGSKSACTFGFSHFKYSVAYQNESHFDFLLKFIFGLAALGFGIAAFLAGMQMAMTFTVMYSGAASICGYSAYRMFSRQELHQQLISTKAGIDAYMSAERSASQNEEGSRALTPI